MKAVATLVARGSRASRGDVLRRPVLLAQARRESSSALIVGGAVLAIGATTAQYALTAYRAYRVEAENAEKEAADAKERGEDTSKAASGTGSWNPFANVTGMRYYDGGFDDKMSRREAALILGVRESATKERINEAHRRIMLLNHPDRGGSPLLAAKINEAKDLLARGKD